MDMRRFGLGGLVALALGMGILPACGDDDDDSEDDGQVVVDAGTDAGGNLDAGRDGGTTPTTDAGGNPAGDAGSAQTIVATAVADGRFTTLAKALTDTNLVATLQGAGPFTVFAPTDAAFQALGQATLGALTTEQLRTILLYHVIPGELPSTALKSGPVKTASELTAFVNVSGSGVKVNDSNVTTANVDASNGVIHVIDKVLLPPNIVQAAQLAGGFSTLLSAATRAGLADTLAAPNANVTVFAPTDAAFAALPTGTVEGLSNTQLANVLRYHVVSGRVLSTALTAGPVPTLLTGQNVTVSLTGGPKINDANVTAADIATTNGVIHVIDKVLLPSTP